MVLLFALSILRLLQWKRHVIGSLAYVPGEEERDCERRRLEPFGHVASYRIVSSIIEPA